MKYKKDFAVHFNRFPLFRFSDAERFLTSIGASPIYARKFMSIAVNNGLVYRITKGVYSMHNDINLVGFAFKPFYYGLGTALTYHGLWEQQATQTIITTKNVREGTRVFFGLNATVLRIPERLFFGFADEKYGNFHFYVSDVEKTLIDIVHYGFAIEDYAYVNLLRRANSMKIESYLKRCPERIKLGVRKLQDEFGAQKQGPRVRMRS